MTLPSERARAVTNTREFLLRLINSEKTPRVPKKIREEAHRLLRHYPGDFYIEQSAKESPSIWEVED